MSLNTSVASRLYHVASKTGALWVLYDSEGNVLETTTDPIDSYRLARRAVKDKLNVECFRLSVNHHTPVYRGTYQS